jgi:ATP-dependent exoDNAse (exonuclease V) alpha subunit
MSYFSAYHGMGPKEVPEWVYTREALWNQVNSVEKRIDAQTARDITLALPKELDLEKQVALVKQFCQSCFTNKGMVADINIHHDNPENPHAHVLLTLRNLSATGFTSKNREWNDKK